MADSDHSLLSPNTPAVYVVGQTGPVIISVGRFSDTATLHGDFDIISIEPFYIDVGRFRVDHAFSESVSYKFIPDSFVGLAVTHQTPSGSTEPFEAEKCTVYKKGGDGAYLQWYDFTAPVVYRTCEFQPGGRRLLIGGNNISGNAIAVRNDGLYASPESGSLFWSRLESGLSPNISWSSDAKMMVAGHLLADPHKPLITVWHETEQEFLRDLSQTGMVSRRDWVRAEVSPDGRYIIMTASEPDFYDSQTPWVWAYQVNRGAGYPTYDSLDINLGESSPISAGSSVRWSPDSSYCCVGKTILKWDPSEEEFYVLTTLASGDPFDRVAWSPDSQYLVTMAAQNFYIWKRTGDNFALTETISLTSGTAQAACWTKCGKYLFLGGDSPGWVFRMYEQDGDTFTHNSDNDFSTIKRAVSSITTSEDPIQVSINRFQDVSRLQDGVDFYSGLLANTGRFFSSESLALSGFDILVEAEIVDIGRFSIETRLKDLAFLTTADIGRLSVTDQLHGLILFGALYADVGRFNIQTGLTDPKYFILPGRSPFAVRYRCTLTGNADGVADVFLPISSFQARLRNGEKTYLGIVVPNVSAHESMVAVRPNGELVLEMGYVFPSSTNWFEIVRTSLDAVGYDKGPFMSSISLSGYVQEPNEMIKAIDVTGIQTESLQKDGRYRIRCDLAPHIRPGDTVKWDGKSIIVGMIAMNVSGRIAYMDITEAVA